MSSSGLKPISRACRHICSVAGQQLGLTKRDCVKYPFTDGAVEYVRSLNVNVSDLGGGELPVLALAEKRVTDALTGGEVDGEIRGEYDQEVLVYPTALMLITAAGDEQACRRYAMAEAKRAYVCLRQETPEFLIQFAANTFGWNGKTAERTVGELFFEVALGYPEYLRNAVKIRDPVWKLTNRVLDRGFVYCNKGEFARLLEEEARTKMLSRITELRGQVQSFLPETVASCVAKIKTLAAARAQRYGSESIPKIVLAAAMPPCMKTLLASLNDGKHLPHIGRFTITAFLSNIGATDEDILKMFHTQDDFTERVARYQVEHIAGSRPGRKKYTPPSCKTMKTHSLCINPDQLCATIAHPLAYYRRRAWAISHGRLQQSVPSAPTLRQGDAVE